MMSTLVKLQNASQTVVNVYEYHTEFWIIIFMAMQYK